MEREGIKQRIEEIGDCGCGADHKHLSCPCMKYRDEVLAEFDRLTAEVELMKERIKDTDTLYAKANDLQAENERLEAEAKAWADVYDREVDKVATLQSHLDGISELAKPSLGFVGARLAAADLRQQGWEAIPMILNAIADYLDSQKPSEKPPVYLFDSHLAMVEGKLTRHNGDWQDCPTCNPPKCEHKKCRGWNRYVDSA
jgi:hypothetical protein